MYMCMCMCRRMHMHMHMPTCTCTCTCEPRRAPKNASRWQVCGRGGRQRTFPHWVACTFLALRCSKHTPTRRDRRDEWQWGKVACPGRARADAARPFSRHATQRKHQPRIRTTRATHTHHHAPDHAPPRTTTHHAPRTTHHALHTTRALHTCTPRTRQACRARLWRWRSTASRRAARPSARTSGARYATQGSNPGRAYITLVCYSHV